MQAPTEPNQVVFHSFESGINRVRAQGWLVMNFIQAQFFVCKVCRHGCSDYTRMQDEA